jgi:polysaccharide biosynthesis transport protein
MTDRPADDVSPRRNPRGRRFVFTLLASALLLGLAFGAGFLLRPAVYRVLRPQVYTATAQILVARHPPSLLAFPPHAVREDESEFAIFQQTQVAHVKSRLVLNAALRNPTVQGLALLRDQPDHLAWLEQEVKVDFHGGPEILSISLSGQDPEELTRLVDAIQKAYLKEVIDVEVSRQRQTMLLLKEVASRYDKKLRDIRTSMRKLREQVRTGDPEALALLVKMATMEANHVQNELLTVRSELRRKRVELSAPGSNEKPPDTPRGAIDEDPAIQRGLQEVTRLEAELAERKKLLKEAEEDASYQKVHLILNTAKQSLATRREAVAKRMREKADAERQAQAQGIRDRVAHLESLEKVLTKDLERLSRESKSLQVRTLDLEDFQEAIKMAQGMAEMLNRRVEILSVEQDAPPRMHRMNVTAVVTGPH